MAQNSNHVVLKNVRLSYCNLLEPIDFNNQGSPKYRTDILIKKDDVKNINAVKNAIAASINYAKQDGGTFEKIDLSKLKNSGNWHSPLKDGDALKSDDSNYKDCYFISAWNDPNGKKKMQIIRTNRQIIDKNTLNATDMIYSGCYVNIGIDFVAYAKLGKAGLCSIITNILTLEKGERLDGGMSAEEEFANDFESNESNVLEVDGEDLF